MPQTTSKKPQPVLDREARLDLIQRSLGLRHKLKVHESMKAPETHEDLAVMLHAKWDLEDELAAIEEILAHDRRRTIEEKRAYFESQVRSGVELTKKKFKKPSA